jgi:polyhydroxyalkanoate synthesis regulator phasin
MADKKGAAVVPLATAAVIGGAAVAAVVLTKKEHREKAKKLVTNLVKRGKKFMENPEAKAVVGAIAEKGLERVVDKDNAKKIVEVAMPQDEGNGNKGRKEKKDNKSK